MHLGKKIKIARITKGYTQQELADKIGKTRPLISAIEQTGRANNYTLKAICQALGLDVDDLENDTVSDPLSTYRSKKDKAEVDRLNAEIDKLRNEQEILKDLVGSQKEVIKMLKTQLEKRKK
jgi:transcriptional regulator with XRE-family HTH domain